MMGLDVLALSISLVPLVAIVAVIMFAVNMFTRLVKANERIAAASERSAAANEAIASELKRCSDAQDAGVGE